MVQGIDIDVVRAELGSRIAALDAQAPQARAIGLAASIDEIRQIAHAAGLNATVTVAHFIEAALQRGERGVLIHGWLQILRDAVGAERQDLAACDAFAAACSIRLAA